MSWFLSLMFINDLLQLLAAELRHLPQSVEEIRKGNTTGTIIIVVTIKEILEETINNKSCQLFRTSS